MDTRVETVLYSRENDINDEVYFGYLSILPVDMKENNLKVDTNCQ